jgi:siroheme synthase
VLSGTLQDIAQRAQDAGVQAPALLIVGDVAARAAAAESGAHWMPQELPRA